MKTNITLLFGLILIVAIYGTIQAQDVPPNFNNNQRPPGGQILLDDVNPSLFPRLVQRRPSPIADAMKELQDAKTDEEKEAARENLKQQLEKQYDAYLDQHEKQLKQLEDRLTHLREQLEKRRDAKSNLVDLRLQLLISEADGLGWPADNRGSYFSPRPAIPGATGPGNPFAPTRTMPAPNPKDAPDRRSPTTPRNPPGLGGR